MNEPLAVREAPARYQVMPDVHVRPGYKQTGVGMIPESWCERSFGSLYMEPSRNGIYKTAEFQGKGTRIVNMGEMFGYEFISDQDMSRVLLTKKELLSSALQDGDLLFGRRSVVPAGAGKCSLVIAPQDPITFESSIIRVRLNQGEAHPPFFYYFFASSTGRSVMSQIVTGTNIKGIRASELRELEIPLPTKAEQEAIAEALNDADALIDSLEQFITKRRHLKQGAMQELLTPKEGWIEKKLGNSATLKARIGWQGLTTAEYLHTGDYYLVTGTDFEAGYIDWEHCYYVDESRFKQDKFIQLKQHDVLVTKDGTIGKVALVNHLDKPATLNSGVFVIRPTDGAFHPEFFYYLLCSSIFSDFLTQLCAGSTINHLYQKDFVTFNYKTPATIDEQTAIATILSDMDTEIAALEQQLAKARDIKQGMMQELLTGNIRLI